MPIADPDPARSAAVHRAARDYLVARYVMLREQYYGPTFDALTKLQDAEDALWKALGGRKGLIEAARKIGVRMIGPDAERVIPGKPLRRLPKVSRPRVRLDDSKPRKRVRLEDHGLFD